MTDMLAADIAALHDLGRTLAGLAGDIKGIKHTKAVTMPNSPVGAAATETGNTVLGAYLHIGVNVSRMGDAAATSATSYESADAGFAGELKAYQAGQ